MPSQREVLVSSLEWAIELARTASRPTHPNHVAGLAAYEAWASGLEVDADYPTENPEVMATRAMIHTDQCVMLHERTHAAAFLRNMVGVAPEAADDLEAAAALYGQTAELGAGLWQGGDGAQAWLARAETRHRLASTIRQAAAREAEAVGHLEAALAKLRQQAPAEP